LNKKRGAGQEGQLDGEMLEYGKGARQTGKKERTRVSKGEKVVAGEGGGHETTVRYNQVLNENEKCPRPRKKGFP